MPPQRSSLSHDFRTKLNYTRGPLFTFENRCARHSIATAVVLKRERLFFRGHGNGPPFLAALASQFEQTHHVECPVWRDGQLGFAEKGIAQIGVEVAVVAVRRGNAALGEGAVFRKGKQTPVFLRIEGLFDERALRSVQNKPRASRGSQNGGTQVRSQTARIMKSEVERIIGNSTF